MYSGVLALKYQLKEKFAVYGRGELFSDKQGFMGGVIIDNDLKHESRRPQTRCEP